MLLRGLSAYTRHQPDSKEEKCLISIKLWSFCCHLWEWTGLLKGLWCWKGARKAQWWWRICSFPPFFLFLHSLWEPSPFSLLQDTLTPNARLSQNTGFPLFAPQISLSLLHNTRAGVQPCWRREGLGWRKGLKSPAWTSVANPHPSKVAHV